MEIKEGWIIMCIFHIMVYIFSIADLSRLIISMFLANLDFSEIKYLEVKLFVGVSKHSLYIFSVLHGTIWSWNFNIVRYICHNWIYPLGWTWPYPHAQRVQWGVHGASRYLWACYGIDFMATTYCLKLYGEFSILTMWGQEKNIFAQKK